MQFFYPNDLEVRSCSASHEVNQLESSGSVLISNNKKQKYLLDCLLTNTNKEEEYTLYLVSCYFHPDSAESIIVSLLDDKIKLSNVKIFIDRGTALACGKNELLKWQTKLSDNYQLKIELKAVNSNNLFHVKAYFLKSNNKNHGNLVIGSANLTKSGIGSASLTKSELIRDDGNTELLFHVLDNKLYDEFNQKLDDITKKSAICLSKINQFKDGGFQSLSKNDKIYFKFCILVNGFFIDNDSMTTDFLVLKYKCNEKWKEDNLKSKDDKTYWLSEDYFKIDKELNKIFRLYNPFHSVDWGKYAIQTMIGYWIPKQLVKYLEDWDNKGSDRNQYRKQIDKLWEQKIENSQIYLEIKNDILKYITNSWLEESWFENILEASQYKSIKKDCEINKITIDCLNNYDLASKVSEKIATVIIDKRKKDLLKKSSERKLLLRYKILDRSMFIDFNYEKVINHSYSELTDKQKNGNKQIFKVIKMAEKYCDPFLIEKILEADDLWLRYHTLFNLNLYCYLYNFYIERILSFIFIMSFTFILIIEKSKNLNRIISLKMDGELRSLL